MRRILKWTVRADDKEYQIGGGAVVLVDCQHDDWDAVQVWTDEPDDGNVIPRQACIFGTGHPLPPNYSVIGSTAAGPFVWHVLVPEAAS